MNEAAIRRLQELADENGGTLTPRVVVDDARKHRGGPLHALFDWDDASAADKQRLDKARELIRSVKLEITVEESEISIKAPYWHHDPVLPAGEQGYISTPTVRSDVDKARAVVAAECACAVAAVHRAQRVAASLGLHADLADLERAINAVRERATAPEPAPTPPSRRGSRARARE